jgi:hypothetical protein
MGIKLPPLQWGTEGDFDKETITALTTGPERKAKSLPTSLYKREGLFPASLLQKGKVL